jgi:hypothetical protein
MQQQQQQQQQQAASVQQPAAENPFEHFQHRYMTRRRLQAIRRAQADPRQPQQQQQQGAVSQTSQQQQGQSDTSSGSQGWTWAVVFGIIAVVSEVVTAVTTAYTESLRPSAELLWQVAALLFLYLLLPLLQMLLVAVKLLLRGFARVIKAVFVPLGRKLRAAWAGQMQHPQQAGGSNQKRAKHLLWPWGRIFSRSRGSKPSHSAAAGATSKQQQLMLLAEQHLGNVNSMYPGTLTLFDFDVLSSAAAGFSSEQRLDPSSGYGDCAYKASGLNGEPAAVHVSLLLVPLQSPGIVLMFTTCVCRG